MKDKYLNKSTIKNIKFSTNKIFIKKVILI